ncbi:MAG: TolC family protein [Saprospiraceae bacterium]|nr:TolC family protein [Saprospiraceae bacterium]
MRKLIVIACLTTPLCSLIAQPIDNTRSGNRASVINASPNSLDDVRPLTFEDYLVQLAWQNSFEVEGAKHEMDARSQEISLAKKDWTRNLQAGLNMNDVSFPYFLYNSLGKRYWFGNPIDPTRIPSVATYPMWNIGAGVNFGDLLVRKNKVKFAENRLKISEADMNSKKQKLRGEVLKRYQEYVSSFDILKVRIQALDAAEANKNQIQSLFSVNKVQFEDYNTANKAYYDALESKVRVEGEIKLKRIALEELIGVKWESVERVKVTYDDQKEKLNLKSKD